MVVAWDKSASLGRQGEPNAAMNETFRSSSGTASVMFETIGHCTKSQGLDSRKGSSLRLSIGHHAWQCRHFANPAAIFLLFQLDLELGNLCRGYPINRSTKAKLSPTTRKIKVTIRGGRGRAKCPLARRSARKKDWKDTHIGPVLPERAP